MMFEALGVRQLVFPRYILDSSVQAGSAFFGKRPVGPFLQPVATGFAMVCIFLLAMYALSKWRGFLPKLGSVILCAVTPIGVFMTYTRSVYLSLFLSLVILSVFGRKLRKYAIVLIVAAVLVILGNWGRVTTEDRSAGGLATESTAISRLVIMETSFKMFADHPFAGVGFNQYEKHRLPYVRQVRSTFLGVRTSKMGKAVKQHNQFLLVLTELGIAGFVPLCLIYYFLVRMLWRARNIKTDLYDYEFLVVVWCIMVSYLVNAMLVNPSFFEFMNAFPLAMAGIIAGGYQRATLGGWNNNGQGERSS
jgi:O-antigen ligase